MHELAITQSVVDAVTGHVGDQQVAGVRLEIGALSGVVPDAVRFCFDVVVQDTPLADALLEITECPGRGRCRDCGREFEIRDLIVLCTCGSADVAIFGGRELRIRSVEVV